MKTRIHRGLLGGVLLLLLPGTLIATLGLLGLVGCGIRDGFRASDFPAIVMLAIPPAWVGWGFRLLIGLRQGIHAMLRRKLLVFYLLVMCYCAAWLFAPITHGDQVFNIFSSNDQIIGSIILVSPVLITLFTNPEEKRLWVPPPAIIRTHRESDYFVAWLASRFRL